MLTGALRQATAALRGFQLFKATLQDSLEYRLSDTSRDADR